VTKEGSELVDDSALDVADRAVNDSTKKSTLMQIDDLPEDIRVEIGKGNFVRAVSLAIQDSVRERKCPVRELCRKTRPESKPDVSKSRAEAGSWIANDKAHYRLTRATTSRGRVVEIYCVKVALRAHFVDGK
jgi:hypothetical protein